MSEDVTKEEIIEAIKQVTGKWNEECRVSDIRPLQNGTAAVTVTMPKDTADILLRKEMVRIGLVRCTIEKRINVARCAKCWSFTHKKDKCDGPDRANRCYKCGEGDHIARDCKNEEFCPICDVKGHKVGTIKCPAFKDALQRARAGIRDRRRPSVAQMENEAFKEADQGRARYLRERHLSQDSLAT